MIKLALITGATSGIGEQLSYLLAEKGINLIVSGRNEHKLAELADRLQTKVKVITIAADLATQAGRNKILVKIHELVPDLVINNAGFGLYGEALKYQTQEQMQILNVDVVAVLELSLEAARAMIAAEKKGIVMNVSSAAGFQIFPNMSVYGASKAFVNHFSESFDYETRRQGVRILAACPGMVETNFRTRAGGSKQEKRGFGVMTAAYAAEQIWLQIEKQQPIRIFNWLYRFATFLTTYIVPRSIAAKAVQASIAKRQK